MNLDKKIWGLIVGIILGLGIDIACFFFEWPAKICGSGATGLIKWGSLVVFAIVISLLGFGAGYFLDSRNEEEKEESIV